MRNISIHFPGKLVFGNGCSSEFVKDYNSLGLRNLLIVTARPILELIDSILAELKKLDIKLFVYDNVEGEPAIEDLEDLIRFAGENNIDSVAGIGGGSVLDLAKLAAALLKSDQLIHDVFGINKLKERSIYLACLPTTSGTGSEVSPNAILLDKNDNLKKGVVSHFIVPDGAYVDPLLTVSVPPDVTAATGLDALIHCIEEYTNINAHPVIDLYAKEGIKLISDNLILAYKNGNDLKAREKVALGSLYGGIGLGPVNTAAVHALSYPLGGEFHIPHGLSNAVLLPYVMEFNMDQALERYADVAIALGAKKGMNDFETAKMGIGKIYDMCNEMDVKLKLSALNIPREAIHQMAEGAVKIQRLLINNPKKVSLEDIINIYEEAY